MEEAGVDAIIVQDLGVARIARKFFPGLTLHASTQLVAHNLEGVLAIKELGFKRVVLARELSLAEIRQIKQRCGDMELEVFIHGALCYSISGLCLYGAMEKGRSGNRGKCPYCCRQEMKVEKTGGGGQRNAFYPFSMKDLRLGEDVRKLAEIGVDSLKIEGRMKSPLYVASVTKWYRQYLGEGEKVKVKGEKVEAKGEKVRSVTSSDLETVFSRRTTELRFHCPTPTSHSHSISLSPPIDATSFGHRGTPIGTVKRITRDREGRAWLRFHTMRALEKHDGLQFDALTDEGRHFGFGITELRPAISRASVFEVAAGEDVEVLLPGAPQNYESREFDESHEEWRKIKSGDTVYCSMSNAVKRMFPAPSFRRSDYPGVVALDVEVTIAADSITASASRSGGALAPASKDGEIKVAIAGEFAAAKVPEKTFASVEKAMSKLGETDYRLGKLTLVDPERRFAPMSVLNDLRRDLVERLDEAREAARQRKVDDAIDSLTELPSIPHLASSVGGSDKETAAGAHSVVKVREGQKIPTGEWDEVVVAVNADSSLAGRSAYNEGAAAVNSQTSKLPNFQTSFRLALPVWNGELEFNKLRSKVKALIREGFVKWECSDLATLRLLKSCGVSDITADWTLYAFNSAALAALAEAGVKRFVASPENCRENLQFLAESGYAVEFLKQQSTPLFISLHEPCLGASASAQDLAVFRRDGLWVTTKKLPRSFDTPAGVATRIDLSWDADVSI